MTRLCKFCLSFLLSFCFLPIIAQTTLPSNDVANPKAACYALINATVVKAAGITVPKATVLVRKGLIVAVGASVQLPKDALVIDCSGKYIYPSFIDMYSDYGIGNLPPAASRPGFQAVSATKGPYGWNQAIRSENNAYQLFSVNESKAKELRAAGFGAVLTHAMDGISRGTGALVSLAAERDNQVVIKERASAHYSFNKGSSTQDYPNSLMGMIALLRQNFLDAQWYKTKPAAEGLNLSLQAFNDNQPLPQVFESNDKWNNLRADKIGDEFGVQYILKGGGNEYQRIAETKATGARLIIPVNFPAALDISDPLDARYVDFATLKHWEMAPGNLAALEQANIEFAVTANGLKDPATLLANLRRAIRFGLSQQRALDALTKVPATMLGVYQQAGSIEPGKLANLLVCSGPIFNEGTELYDNWVQGIRYPVKQESLVKAGGRYQLFIGSKEYALELKSASNTSGVLLTATDTCKLSIASNDKLIQLSFKLPKDSIETRLSGVVQDSTWSGTGQTADAQWVSWRASLRAVQQDSSAGNPVPAGVSASVVYPFSGYGSTDLPVAQTMLIQHATIWTNEKEGILTNADLLIKNGKIAAIGKGLAVPGAILIDASGKHVSAGIIDEHSHIALAGGVNECTQSVTAEVRVADVIDPDDADIYRNLSGGVTSSHILHGSCNTIGGQTQLLKLRWGANAEQLKFANWDPFIKFALGENVKNTRVMGNTRFPDTRMGVEQVLTDAFTRASTYRQDKAVKRKDLELEALVEIMEHKRFITCHSYVQSEINMMMKVAEQFGFTVNTFTHILEGYKVADKMKAHGAAASTFSDWWSYKMEVADAIPQNAYLMQQQGLNVAINSDDAEMASRLNQEAAKSVKYAGMDEISALKMVTLNPAAMLHVADRTGSIKVGKDADVVIWTDHPLSIYAKADKTIVDGVIYFDREKDQQLSATLAAERSRLIQKMIAAKNNGEPTTPAVPSFKQRNHCEEDAGEDYNIWQEAE